MSFEPGTNGNRWIVLGAGTRAPRPGYGMSCHLLEVGGESGLTLFDCGPGSVRALTEFGASVEMVSRVVLSHDHCDHCLDLFALAFARNDGLVDAPHLELIGPKGLGALLAAGEKMLGASCGFADTEVIEVGAEELESGPLRLTAALNGHKPTSLSWRVDLPDGASVAYTGDTPETPVLAELARGVDLFVSECSFPDGTTRRGHLTPSGAARIARGAACRTLALTHFYPEVDPEAARLVAAEVFGGPVLITRDGSILPITAN